MRDMGLDPVHQITNFSAGDMARVSQCALVVGFAQRTDVPQAFFRGGYAQLSRQWFGMPLVWACFVSPSATDASLRKIAAGFDANTQRQAEAVVAQGRDAVNAIIAAYRPRLEGKLMLHFCPMTEEELEPFRLLGLRIGNAHGWVGKNRAWRTPRLICDPDNPSWKAIDSYIAEAKPDLILPLRRGDDRDEYDWRKHGQTALSHSPLFDRGGNAYWGYDGFACLAAELDRALNAPWRKILKPPWADGARGESLAASFPSYTIFRVFWSHRHSGFSKRALLARELCPLHFRSLSMRPLSAVHRKSLVASVSILALVAASPLSAQEPTDVPPIMVSAPPLLTRDQALQNDGTDAEGYRALLVSGVGLFDQTKIMDLPYSLSVAPQDLIADTQAPSGETVLSMMPSVQVSSPENAGDGTAYQSRGFQMATTIDGMFASTANVGTIAIEDKERVEQLSGVSGFLYGPNNYLIGGVVNYVTKRPTATPFAEVTIGNYGGINSYIHGDFSGPIAGTDRIGYRLNIVGQGLGDDAIENQRIGKGLFSGALDVKLTDTTLLQFNYSYENWRITAPTMYQSLTGLTFPAPDLSQTGAPLWSYKDWVDNRASVRLRSDPTDFLTLRAGFQYNNNYHGYLFTRSLGVASDGSYSQLPYTGTTDYLEYDGSVYADLKLNPLGIKNTFTVGYSTQNSVSRGPAFSNDSYAVVGGFNLFNPFETAEANANVAAVAASLSSNSTARI